MAKYNTSANCTFVIGNLNDLAIQIQALIDGAKTITQVVKGRETGVYLIIHS